MQLSIPPSSLIDITGQFGMPLFVYDAQTIDRKIQELKSSFSVPKLEIRYASKALNTIAILAHIHQQGCGIDTVSTGEILMALKAGVPPDKISFTPSGVKTEEYAFAIQHGIHIHVDQTEILDWLDRHYPGIEITLRFNPAVQAGGHPKLQVGSHGSKFGFLSEQVEDVVKKIDGLSIKVAGVHMHLGSDISDSGSFDRAYAYLLDVALHWKNTLKHIDLGGGFKVPYHPDDHSIDIPAFGEKVTDRFTSFCQSLGKEIALVLEPGKFIVSESGYLLMEVSNIRRTGDVDMVFVQSGFNHFLRPMSYGAYHHMINLSNPAGTMHHYDIVGYLCETDTFAVKRPMEEVRIGDIICLMNAGAYGYTMASNYNGRPRPAEILFRDNKPELIRRAETMEDLLRTDLSA